MLYSIVIPLYFLHIPKTSGTSINEYLGHLYTKQDIFPFKEWNELYQNPNKNLLILDENKYHFITGHFGWNTKFINKRKTFTIFREPTTRLISELQHIKKWYPSPIWTNTKYNFESSLFDSIDEKEFINSLSNIQTRYLITDYHPINEILNFKDANNYFFEETQQFKSSLKNSFIIKNKIKKRLKRLSTFGIYEYQTESIFLLQNLLEENLKLVNIHEMKSQYPSDSIVIPEEFKRKIDFMNKYDNYLYEKAFILFQRNWLNLITKKLGITLTFKDYLDNKNEIIEKLLVE